ncbi:type I restriction endonuclease subunit S [Vagococcus fluvialis]|uniref:restriction endonuclease subunit S n=1 Tax=Vagococcus fluvialis TaxID=2738 RepID=UPI0014330BBA|nr:restriction endonuclease subunit S [Vagococcus fluvialis]NKC60174.1 type I restriction endonuclease subunit S [Vagococcus fluvialis]NKD51049.1 type I restriction endonuclease subunit S [Vagococcus fluvialis]
MVAWEQRKVSDIVKFHKQGFYTKESYSENNKYFLLRGTELTSNKLVLNDTPKINATEKDYNDFKVDKGDFLIVRSGTVGTYGIVYDDIKAIFGSYLINFRFDMGIVTNEFFGLFYQSNVFKNQLNKIIQKSSNVNINAENIKSTTITLPYIEEQQKISSFFKNLDGSITLQERELELLKLTKKGFLQQLFTDNQQKFPNIRFANFHDEWQQRKLGDTLLFLKSGLSRLFSNIDIGLPVVRANNINNGILNMKNDVKYWYQIDTKGAKNENYYIHKNDILINFINSEAKMGTAAVVREEPARETIYTTNILKAQVNKDYEHYFWFSLTQINKYKNDIKLITKPAVNQASFTTVDFKKLSYKFPNIDEQAKIGSFFKQLDETILIQERKLEKLKRLKKAFLQKMFI